MAVEVETPEDYAGNVMGDLSSRRGMVQGMDDMPGGGKVIKAEVPLSEMFGYSTTLRSMSQGRATYTMEFKHYSRGAEERRRRDHHARRASKSTGLGGRCQWQRVRVNLKQHWHRSLIGDSKWQKANSSGPSRT